MKNKITFLIFIFALEAAAGKAEAVCPVCTVAVGAGIGLSRWLGIGDLITGLWLGAFLLSLALWAVDWLGKRKIRSPFAKFAVILAGYAMAIVPLYYAEITAHPIDFLRSATQDKLILGIIEGSTVFFFAVKLYEFLKERNHGRAHFPFEKIAIPIALLAFFSLILHFLTI